MKKVLLIATMVIASLAAISCTEKSEPQDIKIQLTLDGNNYAIEGVTVKLTGTATLDGVTDKDGVAALTVPVGIYDVSVSFNDGQLMNGTTTITVVDVTLVPDAKNEFTLPLEASASSSLLIKEVYATGCQKDDGSGNYSNDRYLILYNNSAEEIDASNICIGHTNPANNYAANKYKGTDGTMSYFAEKWIPCGWAYWGFKTKVIIPAYSQILISMCGAVDHTATHSKSVDLRHADYVMYDTEKFDKTDIYPAPDASIDPTHYMTAYKYGAGTAWTTSLMSPGFFIFRLSQSEANAFITAGHTEKNDKDQDVFIGDNLDYTIAATLPNAKIKNEWVVDAVEVFHIPNLNKSVSRLPASIDAGYVKLLDKQGYSLYRNVDKAATEALPENAGKLVYNYAGGTTDVENGSTDPSGIDAEASIAAGAHIIYMDTNNSTNDFHMRKVASIKK